MLYFVVSVGLSLFRVLKPPNLTQIRVPETQGVFIGALVTIKERKKASNIVLIWPGVCNCVWNSFYVIILFVSSGQLDKFKLVFGGMLVSKFLLCHKRILLDLIHLYVFEWRLDDLPFLMFFAFECSVLSILHEMRIAFELNKMLGLFRCKPFQNHVWF